MTARPERLSDGSALWHGYISDVSDRVHAKEEVQRQLDEKSLLLKETHHRIKNHMATIRSLLSLQARSTENPAVADAMQEAGGRVEAMRALYERMLVTETYRELSLRHYLDGLVRASLAVLDTPDDLSVRVDIEECTVSSRLLFLIGIMVNELVTNAVKYAFQDAPAAELAVVTTVDDSEIAIIVEDSGNGLPEHVNTERPAGFGLQLVTMLCEQIGAAFSIESDNGTRATISIPTESANV